MQVFFCPRMCFWLFSPSEQPPLLARRAPLGKRPVDQDQIVADALAAQPRHKCRPPGRITPETGRRHDQRRHASATDIDHQIATPAPCDGCRSAAPETGSSCTSPLCRKYMRRRSPEARQNGEDGAFFQGATPAPARCRSARPSRAPAFGAGRSRFFALPMASRSR